MPARSREIEAALKELEREYHKAWTTAGKLMGRVNSLCLDEANELLKGRYGEADRVSGQVESFLRALEHVGRVLEAMKILRESVQNPSEPGEGSGAG